MATPISQTTSVPMISVFTTGAWAGKRLNVGFGARESEAGEGPSLLSFPDVSHDSQNTTQAGLKHKSPVSHHQSIVQAAGCFALLRPVMFWDENTEDGIEWRDIV